MRSLAAPLVLLLLTALTACRTPAGATSGRSSSGEKGRLVRVQVDEKALHAAHGGARHALLIGISHFQDTAWHPLRYAAKDAEDVGRVLQDPARGGFASVTRLTRPEDTTRAGLLRALEGLRARALGPQDVVVVYVSSHGTLARDVQGELQRYLVTSDTSFRDVADTGLSMAALEQALEALGSRRKVLVLATCHSGGGKSLLPPDVRAELERTKGPLAVRPLEEASRASIVLSASDYGEAAREDDALGNDIYTHFLLQALDGPGDRNLDGAVSATEAHDFARRGTYAYTQGRQRPSAHILEVGADPVLLSGRLQRPGQPELFSYNARLEGFTLKVDGREVGQLPGGVVVPAGARAVQLEKGGQVLWQGPLTLGAGERRDLAGLLPGAGGRTLRDGRRALTLGAGSLGFLDRSTRHQVLPAMPLLSVGLHLPQALLEGRLDVWLDVGGGQGMGRLDAPVTGAAPVALRHRALLAGVTLGTSWALGPVELATGPRVAALWLQRSFPDMDLVKSESYATLWPGWMVGAAWRAHARLVLSAQGHLLWAYVPVDGRVRMVGFGTAQLAGGYRF